MLISIVYTTSRLGRFMLGMRFMRGFIYKLSGYGVCTREVMSVRKRRRYSYVTEDQIRTAAQDLEKKLHADDLDQELKEANRWAVERGIKTPSFPCVVSNRRTVLHFCTDRKKKFLPEDRKALYHLNDGLKSMF